jgi:hypothetical protein
MNANLFNRFLLKWILITNLGWLFAQVIGELVTRAAFPKAEPATLITAPLYWTIFGLLFGLSQWISFRDRVLRSFRWVLATAIGFYVAALTIKLLNRSEIIHPLLRDFPFLVHLFSGMIIGFAQYQAIKKALQGASIWIIIVAVGWALSQIPIELYSNWIEYLGILVFTTVTGFGFSWLTQNRSSEIPAG